jgi:hypothetical protein
MFLGILENDRQYKGTGVLLHGHPGVGQHDARATIHVDHMMIIPDELLRLLAGANGGRLMWVNLIE